MYYAANLISYFLTIIAIALVHINTVPSWLIMILLLAAGCFQMITSACVVSMRDELENRIKKLENRKADK